jgi:hypothetical protein
MSGKEQTKLEVTLRGLFRSPTLIFLAMMALWLGTKQPKEFWFLQAGAAAFISLSILFTIVDYLYHNV